MHILNEILNYAFALFLIKSRIFNYWNYSCKVNIKDFLIRSLFLRNTGKLLPADQRNSFSVAHTQGASFETAVYGRSIFVYQKVTVPIAISNFINDIDKHFIHVVSLNKILVGCSSVGRIKSED